MSPPCIPCRVSVVWGNNGHIAREARDLAEIRGGGVGLRGTHLLSVGGPL